LAGLPEATTRKKSGYKPKKQFINNKEKAKCMPSKNGIAATPKRKEAFMNKWVRKFLLREELFESMGNAYGQ